MSPRAQLPVLLLVAALTACGASPDSDGTIGSLSKRKLDVESRGAPTVEREEVIESYKAVLETEPRGELYQESLRRLADLNLSASQDAPGLATAGKDNRSKAQLNTAIAQYEQFLRKYPNSPNTEKILYQLAKAYESAGRPAKALATLDLLVKRYPGTATIDEVHFRRGEIMFTLGRFGDAARAYDTIVRKYPNSVYHERALYKYAWSEFKQGRHLDSLHAFFRILDDKLAVDAAGKNLSRGEQEILGDALRVVSLAFSYLHTEITPTAYFKRYGKRPYEALIYENLGNLYLEKERIRDAAATYLAFSTRHPNSVRAPEFHENAIKAYEAGGFASLIVPAKESFVRGYGIDSRFWKNHDETVREKLRPQLALHTRELATHYHALAKKSRKKEQYELAAQWYGLYLRSFPQATDAAKMNFLLAECWFDSGRYADAVKEYEKVAYHYTPRYEKANEAGYAALVAYDKLEKQTAEKQKNKWRQAAITSALMFSATFPSDKRVPTVMARTSEQLFKTGDYSRAIESSQRILQVANPANTALLVTAWTTLGHGYFETGDYVKAEEAYRQSLQRMKTGDKLYSPTRERLAASVYKQGEQQRAAGNLDAAVADFTRVKSIAPGSALAVTAQYDAASVLITQGSWAAATSTLEKLRLTLPTNHQLQKGVTEKLALTYMKTGQSLKGAREMEQLSRSGDDAEYQQEMLWQAATLYQDGGKRQKAAGAYYDYLKRFPTRYERGVEARYQLAEIYKASRQTREQQRWLKEVIRAESSNPQARTERTRFLAATATLELAEPYRVAYSKVRLTVPLKKSLKTKKDLMQSTLAAYKQAMGYQVAEVSTAATYRIGELYRDFAESLIKSERPRKLNAEELEQYEFLLEEQAYPFEEKSIDIHASNVARISDGIYDQWVQNSLKVLAELQPARYAKSEKADVYSAAIH